jgi:carboxymethylenebutenolidase
MSVSHHSLPVEDGKLPLTIARADGSGAAVVIMPSAFGIGPDLEAQMQELAAKSRLVVALDPFFREDPGPAAYDDFTRAMGRLQAYDRARGYRDVRAVVEWAREQSGKPVVFVGICFGGPHALLVAADGLASGIVTWHGTRMEAFLERATEMRCPMRHHFGSLDPFVNREAVETIRKAFAGRPDVEFFVHEGATHGFSHRASTRSYQERAERAAMDSVLELVESV